MMDCAKVVASVRKAKKKQVKGELDRLKQAEKKKRRLEKALATSAAICSELEKKKQKKKEEQERLDEEGAAVAEAVALHVLLGEDLEDSSNVVLNKDVGLASRDRAQQIDVIFRRRQGLVPYHDQPNYSFESTGRTSDARIYGQMQNQWGNCTWATDPREKYFYSLCYEEDDLCYADLAADHVAAQAVSSLKIADDARVDAYVFNHFLKGEQFSSFRIFYKVLFNSTSYKGIRTDSKHRLLL